MLSVGQIVFPRKELGKIRSASFPELVQSNLSKSLSWLHKAASMSQEFCFLGSEEEECTQKEICSIAGEGGKHQGECLPFSLSSEPDQLQAAGSFFNLYPDGENYVVLGTSCPSAMVGP